MHEFIINNISVWAISLLELNFKSFSKNIESLTFDRVNQHNVVRLLKGYVEDLSHCYQVSQLVSDLYWCLNNSRRSIKFCQRVTLINIWLENRLFLCGHRVRKGDVISNHRWEEVLHEFGLIKLSTYSLLLIHKSLNVYSAFDRWSEAFLKNLEWLQGKVISPLHEFDE